VRLCYVLVRFRLNPLTDEKLRRCYMEECRIFAPRCNNILYLGLRPLLPVDRCCRRWVVSSYYILLAEVNDTCARTYYILIILYIPPDIRICLYLCWRSCTYRTDHRFNITYEYSDMMMTSVRPTGRMMTILYIMQVHILYIILVVSADDIWKATVF